MTEKLIGYVGVDSGQLLLCDPCYIDSEWEKEDFQDIRVYEHTTGKRLQYLKDFSNYEEPIPAYDYNTINQLKATGEWKELPDVRKVENNFSYNACCDKTLSVEGHGQLNYNLGHAGVGVAFSTAWGDGHYPVYANYNDKGDLESVTVKFE